MYGFYRLSAAIPVTKVGDVSHNLSQILKLIEKGSAQESSLIVFPELTLTGYTSHDLLMHSSLLHAQDQALQTILQASSSHNTYILIGIALYVQNRLYNCAAVIQKGSILGIVPKQYLPNKKEFYEKRYFSSGIDANSQTITYLGRDVPFGTDLLFQGDETFIFGVELCEDLWVNTPPSGVLSASGATVLCNLSASNALIAKAQYRKHLVQMQSAKCMSAYVYASCGVGESTTDTVFDGDAMIYENGSHLASSKRFCRTPQLISADVDLEKLRWQRLHETMMADLQTPPCRIIKTEDPIYPKKLQRFIDPYPFVPSDQSERIARCEEITDIQAHALLKRLEHVGTTRVVIGVSGGLDSTLALLACAKAYDIANYPKSDIIALTMPGPGTTETTHTNALKLCEHLGVTCTSVPIDDLVKLELEKIDHDTSVYDVTFENVQARIRTALLMNTANKHRALVIGTGDMSEIALGWSTYNGDHMSMYALNCGIPKTLVRYLVAYFAEKQGYPSKVLESILQTPVSPELLPHQEGKIAQKTESIIGPYDLHDFFLYHFLKYGAKPEKILFLASIAFKKQYEKDEIRKWLTLFFERFFANQFKRNCMPDGPKVGTISLSPRADWRMASDVASTLWTQEIKDLA